MFISSRYCLRKDLSFPRMDKSEVIKFGLLKKVKRGKKRFFVLRRDGLNLSASRLDCYESEKKFSQGGVPKSSVSVAEFFNVNRLSLLKNEFCIAIYTKDTSLYLACDSIAEQESWLQALVELVEEERAGVPSSSVGSGATGQTGGTSTTLVSRGNSQTPAGKPLFEFCWEVVVTKFESKDGSHPRKCPRVNSAYRFCLTEEEILLLRKQSKPGDMDDDYSFELNSVSSYGLQGEIFYLTVGRFTMTGSGQLFMKGEDSTTTANIYKTLQKTFEETKSRRKSISEIKKSIGLTPRSSTISRERSNSVATQNRSRGFSESEKTLMNLRPVAVTCRSYQQQKAPSAEALEADPRQRYAASNKLAGVTYGRFDSHNCSTDSVGSSYSVEDPTVYYGKPRCPSAELVDRAAIKEESAADDYLPMERIPSVNVTSASAPPSKGPSSPDGYLMMAQIPSGQSNNSYCAMSPDVKPDLDMINTWNKLEEVKAYIIETTDPWPDPASVRSYSLGSRPTNESEESRDRPTGVLKRQEDTDEVPAGIPISLSSEACQQVTQEDRRRAYSFGNWRRPSAMAKYRRHQHALNHAVGIEHPAQSSAFRVRSESFGSSINSGKGSITGRGRDRKGNGFYGDDLVELDFGTSFTRSPASSSLGSSESLQNRSRAGSTTVQRSWSPKIDELLEENVGGSSPSGRLIAKLFSSPCREPPCDYVPMGPTPQSPVPKETTNPIPPEPVENVEISKGTAPPSEPSGYVVMVCSPTASGSKPFVPSDELAALEKKLEAGVCQIQDEETSRPNEDAEEDPFCVVELGLSNHDLPADAKPPVVYENLFIPESSVHRRSGGSVGSNSSEEKKDEWKVPSVNRPLVRPASVALDRLIPADNSPFLSLSQSPRGRSSLSLSDRPSEKVLRSSSVSSTQPLSGGDKSASGRMKSPLIKLFNSAIGRHSTEEVKSSSTPPPSPSHSSLGSKRAAEVSPQPNRPAQVVSQRHPLDSSETLENQLASVLVDRSLTENRMSSCASDCRRISSGVPTAIEYVTLDFTSRVGDGPKVPYMPTIVPQQCGTTGFSTDATATVYAQIDLSKSEAIKKCVRH